VIGHSNSGAIAIAFAQKYAERVDQLVLADSIGVRVRNGSILRTLFSRAWDSLVEIRLTITGFPDLLFNILFHSKNFFHQVKIAPRTDLRTQLPFVNVRTLIAWGGRDHTLPRECARLMQRSIAKASYVVSRRGSHDWLIERPNEFTDVVSRWSKPHRNLEESAPAPL
jgi:pimeloyl-ACP methyl ester carboxylesterase